MPLPITRRQALAALAARIAVLRLGHAAAPHGDHLDYLVNGHLHRPDGDHCDDHGPVQRV